MDNALNKYLLTASYEPGTILQSVEQNAYPRRLWSNGETFFKYLLIKLEL